MLISLSSVNKYLLLFSIYIVCILNMLAYGIEVYQNDDNPQQSDFPLLIKIVDQNIHTDSLKTVTAIEKISELLQTAKVSEDVVLGYIALSKWEQKKGNLQEAIEIIDSALAVAERVENQSLISKTLTRKGVYQYYSGKYEAATENYLKALEIAKELQDVKLQLNISQNISLVKMQANDIKGAIAISEENLILMEANWNDKDAENYINIHIALCSAYIKIEEYEKASLYCNKGMLLSEKYNDTEAKAYLLSGLGNIAMYNEGYDKAMELQLASEHIIDSLGGLDNLAPFVYLYKGKTHFLKEDYQNAIAELLRIEALKKKNNIDYISLQEMYYLLAKSYQKLNDTENTILYYDKFYELNAKNNKEKKELNTSIIKKFDIKTLEEEVNQLRKTSKISRYKYHMSIIVLLIFVTGFLVFYRIQQQKNKRKFDTLIAKLNEKKQQRAEKPVAKELKDKKPKSSKIIDEKTKELLKRLEEFETKEHYLKNQCGLKDVAKRLKTNTTYLSKVVNTHKEKSFSNYITDLRVNYAVVKLKDDKKFRSYTIDSIAKELGFNRSESFARAFKNKTGLYPSYFIKQLEKQVETA